MSDINDEMKVTADTAIIAAKERFGEDLDFSEQSIGKLEDILGQIYWDFSNHTKNEETSNIISDTAILWGSYLGEYMRLKWGGTWILKGSDSFVSITNIKFSPINFVYQKITSHPEYSVEIYLTEAKRIIYLSVLNPQQSQYLSENIGQPKKQTSIILFKIPTTIDKNILFILAGIGGIILVIVAGIIGYNIIKARGASAFGLAASTTHSITNIPIEKTLGTGTYSINTLDPTVTPMPTYTPKPTITPRPSNTPSLTYTQLATLTPTESQKPHFLKPTLQPAMSPTRVTYTPENTRIPPPPIVITSCEINPSIVPVGNNVTITFIVHFSAPGFGFDALVPNDYPGQSGCSGTDNDGDGVAYCDGSSGELPDATTVHVSLSSSVGDCSVSYSSR